MVDNPVVKNSICYAVVRMFYMVDRVLLCGC